MVSRRILITQPKMNGKQLGEFHFSSMYGVNVTRVNRSGMDIFASRNLTLHGNGIMAERQPLADGKVRRGVDEPPHDLPFGRRQLFPAVRCV